MQKEYSAIKLLRNIFVARSAPPVSPNGCGKSTLFRVVTGLLKPGDGEAKYLGECLKGISPDSRVRMGIGYLKQTKNVFPGLTVFENLQLAGESKVVLGGVDARISELMAVFPILAVAREKRAGFAGSGGFAAAEGGLPAGDRRASAAAGAAACEPGAGDARGPNRGRYARNGADAGCGLAGTALRQRGECMRAMPKSGGVARILIVGDTPALGKTVGAILESEYTEAVTLSTKVA